MSATLKGRASLLVAVILGLSVGVGPASGSSASNSVSSLMLGRLLVSRAVSSSPVSVCKVATEVASLRVQRGKLLNPTSFSFPSVVFVDVAAQARWVAKALCSLPRMTTGTVACPADFGLRYRLSFTTPKVVVTPVTIAPSGGEVVNGLPGVRWIVRSPGFWRVLGSAMRLHQATVATFNGKLT